MVFAHSNSSPTIKVERIDEIDVYISFRNSENTEQLYHELIENIPQIK